jgi:hypothetical protein
VDSQIGFLKNESNVIAPELLARTAAERSIASGDAPILPASRSAESKRSSAVAVAIGKE